MPTLRLFLASLSPLVCIATSVSAQVSLPAILGDHMVVQADHKIPLWGRAEAGAQVEIAAGWGGAPVMAEADGKGQWKAQIATPAAGGPFDLTFRSNGKETIVRDVLVGEVWIGSGQSNMEWPVEASNDPQKEIEAARYPKIRLFHVDNVPAAGPRTDCAGKWMECTPETIRGFSAVAYYFGRELHQKLQIPVGLIETSWGGTRVEAWMDAKTLRPLADEKNDFALLEKIGADPDATKREHAARLDAWRAELNRIAPAPAANAVWTKAKMPAPFESIGLGSFDGIVWFRRNIEFPAEWSGQSVRVSLGPIDDFDVTLLDGVEIGRTDGPHGSTWTLPRKYTIPASLVKPGTHTILVRAHDASGGGGFIGKEKDFHLQAGSLAPVTLAGEWEYSAGPEESKLPPVPALPGVGPNTATALYNGMVAPIAPFGIRGVIWYQGESNIGNAPAYATLFPAMIQNWRATFGQGDFPFLYVQIAPYNYGAPGTLAAALRESQRRSLSVPHTGMVVTTDIGNVRDIHPRNKQEVGRRLALWALAKTYKKEGVVPSGPLFREVRFEHGTARVFFHYSEGGLVAQGGDLKHFEIAGKDGKFVAATAAVDGETVIVKNAAVPEPASVRFGWSDVAEPNLYNSAGLPASPFTSEN